MMYYTAIIDWRISDSMDASFCLDALHEAVMLYDARSFSTPARRQCQGKSWKDALESYRINTGMDGKGRWAQRDF